MLVSMQPEPKVLSAFSPDSFASLLAGFAAPVKKIPPKSDLFGVDDDVVSLSYEQALRSQASFCPIPPPIESVRSLARPMPGSSTHALAENSESGRDARAIYRDARTPAPPATRSSSVTIRLSAPESERLHLRAAEAGLTVSAYLRSCAFEVESLRSEVKATLATLRSESAPGETKLDEPKLAEFPPSRRSTLRRFFTRCFAGRTACKPRL